MDNTSHNENNLSFAELMGNQLAECEKYKTLFRECMLVKGEREMCRKEFQMFALCKMRNDTVTERKQT